MHANTLTRDPTILRALGKLQRDAEMPLTDLFKKSARYMSELSSARWRLRGASHLGTGVRTRGTPRIENLGEMILGNDVYLRSINVPVELCTGPMGSLEIGDATVLNYGVSIGASALVRIGKRFRAGPYVMIFDSHFHDLYDRTKRPPPNPVIIEDDVWLGAKSTVLPGVHIGRGSVIGAGSTVTRDVPDFCIAAGSPARVLRKLDPGKFSTPA